MAASSIPPAAERVAVVVNGNAKSVTSEIIETLNQILLGGDLYTSRRLEELPHIIERVLQEGYGAVLTGGGDGTFSSVVTELLLQCRKTGQRMPRVGMLRLGTGNALAWVAGSSPAAGRGLAADILRLQEDAGSRPLRLVETDGLMAPFAGFGADADVLADYFSLKKKLQETPLRSFAGSAGAYLTAGLAKTLPRHLLRDLPHCRVVNLGGDAFRLGAHGSVLGPPIGRGEVLYEGPMRIVALGTVPFWGFGFRFFPYANERPDRMHLRIASLGVVETVRNLRALWRGELDAPDALFDFLVEEVAIELDPAGPYQVGGDLRGTHSRVTARITPETLRLVDFYAPPAR